MRTYSITYNSDDSTTVPLKCVSMTIECYGAGGAGAGAAAFTAAHRAGGAGGQYAIKTISSPTPGHSIDIIVAPITDGVAGGDASDGEDSYVSVNSIEVCRAKGGESATGDTAGLGAATGGVGDTVYAGGNGADGSAIITYSGGGGGGAGPSGNGSNASTYVGGSSGGGLAHDGADGWQDTAWSHGRGGGGGSGSIATDDTNATAFEGGSGSPGIVKITFTVLSSNMLLMFD